MISISDTRYSAAVQIILYWIAISLFQTCYTLIEEDVLVICKSICCSLSW